MRKNIINNEEKKEEQNVQQNIQENVNSVSSPSETVTLTVETVDYDALDSTSHGSVISSSFPGSSNSVGGQGPREPPIELLREIRKKILDRRNEQKNDPDYNSKGEPVKGPAGEDSGDAVLAHSKQKSEGSITYSENPDDSVDGCTMSYDRPT
jgi:hypothetical protein